MAFDSFYCVVTLHQGGGFDVQDVGDGDLTLHQGGGVAYKRARDGEPFLHQGKGEDEVVGVD